MIDTNYVKCIVKFKDAPNADIICISRHDLINLIRIKLEGLKSIRAFCLVHKLNYNNVIEIKNGSESKYPRLMVRIIELLYDVVVEPTTMYLIKENEG